MDPKIGRAMYTGTLYFWVKNHGFPPNVSKCSLWASWMEHDECCPWCLPDLSELWPVQSSALCRVLGRSSARWVATWSCCCCFFRGRRSLFFKSQLNKQSIGENYGELNLWLHDIFIYLHFRILYLDSYCQVIEHGKLGNPLREKLKMENHRTKWGAFQKAMELISGG